jgi:hypothetical protein
MNEFESTQAAEKELFGHNSTIDLHLASYFRVRKPWVEIQAILRNNGLPDTALDLLMTPLGVLEQMWTDETADKNGMFTFQPGVLILGHTSENVEIPADKSWRMRQYFIDKNRTVLPLTTNVGAPFLHPGSRGPQTYEIINKSDFPITFNISDLICITDVSNLSGPSYGALNQSKSVFSVQKPNKISLGLKDMGDKDLLTRIFEA